MCCNKCVRGQTAQNFGWNKLTVWNILRQLATTSLIISAMLKYIRTVLRIPHVAIRGMTS